VFNQATQNEENKLGKGQVLLQLALVAVGAWLQAKAIFAMVGLPSDLQHTLILGMIGAVIAFLALYRLFLFGLRYLEGG
jgi:uncharacterized membrane protein YeaQ/YmgE (transglycosylase-associated protein family)